MTSDVPVIARQSTSSTLALLAALSLPARKGLLLIEKMPDERSKRNT